MAQSIYLVDAFSYGPFTGNPAGVCPLEGPGDENWMQGVANEMNQAETAFFWPEGDGFHIRWFTPTVEVDLCGHATLATAHVLFSELPLSAMFVRGEGAGGGATLTPSPSPPEGRGESLVRFFTKSGELVCRKAGDKIEMDFPAEPPTPTECKGVQEAINAEPIWVGENRMDWFFVLGSEREVRECKPDMTKVLALGKRGVIVTAASSLPLGGGCDFVSRFFAPQSGIPEDPVTGSAHCALGPYWAQRLNKKTVNGYQASKRGGVRRSRRQRHACPHSR